MPGVSAEEEKLSFMLPRVTGGKGSCSLVPKPPTDPVQVYY